MTNPSRSIAGNIRTRASLAIILGAGVWGLFWIPLRHLANYGFDGLWAVAATLGVPVVIGAPFFARKILHEFRLGYALLGIAIGLSVVFYFGGVIFSDVVRVISLFYMLPIWTTLLGRLFLGEKIGPRKLLAIGLALIGLYLMLGGLKDGPGLPIPSNLGDWFGLIAGFFWACTLVIVRFNPEVDPVLNTTAPFVFGFPIAVIGAFLLMTFAPEFGAAPPGIDGLISGLLFAGLFGLLVLGPSVYLQVWGARFLASSTAALLTMVELLAATFSATLLIGTSLQGIELVGCGIILIAVLLDLTAPVTD